MYTLKFLHISILKFERKKKISFSLEILTRSSGSGAKTALPVSMFGFNNVSGTIIPTSNVHFLSEHLLVSVFKPCFNYHSFYFESNTFFYHFDHF